MENLIELRQKTKSLLRDRNPSIEDYNEALPLCKELWAHFSDTQEFWDAHQYANCLKKLGELDEAENVCSYIYETYHDQNLPSYQKRPFSYILNLYTWVINDKYVKPIRKPDYPYEDIVLNKLFLLHEIIEFAGQDSQLPSFNYCALSVIRVLIKTNKSYNGKMLSIINLIDPKDLSSIPTQYTDHAGKERETASDKETYFQLKSDLLFREKQYEDCVLCCTTAIDEIENFHYDNDIWLERRVALALDNLGHIDDAIITLKKLIGISDKWFLLYELGKFYLRKNETNQALILMLRAACTKDPEKMKVKLIESIGDVFTSIQEIELAQENYNFARQIREENDWAVSYTLNNKIRTMMPIRFVEIRKHWITILHNKVGVKHGRIVKIFPNHRGGFIQANKQYYFQYKNFFGKSDLSKVGDNVDFIIVESFDKKKQQNTEEAVAIIPIRK